MEVEAAAVPPVAQVTPSEWLKAIWETATKNPFGATVMARANWEMLDDALLEEASTYGDAVFTTSLRFIASCHGDPKVTPAQREAARGALRREFPADLEQIMAPLSQQVGVPVPMAFGVALSMSRVDVLRFSGALPPAEDPDRFGETLDAAFAAYDDDPAEAERLAVEAMRVAPADGAIACLRLVLNRNDRAPEPETLRVCAAALSSLAASPKDSGAATGDMIAMLLGVCGARVSAADLASEQFPVLAAAIESVLPAVADAGVRLSVGLDAAGYWMRLGRLDHSDQILARLRAMSGPGDQLTLLKTSVFESSVRGSCGDDLGATMTLLDVLGQPEEEQPGVQLRDRRRALLELLQHWPVRIDPDGKPPQPDLAGVEPWIGQAEELIDRSEAWEANQCRGQLVVSLARLGLVERAGALAREMTITDGSRPDFRDWSAQTRAWVSRHLGPAPADEGDAGKDYVDLALEGRFVEAAAEAERQAALAVNRGLRINAFSDLAAAGDYYRLARDWAGALSAFERAFAMLDHDLVYIPYADLVVSRLANWPDRYLLAALTALDAGEPLRAVEFAETGRARATGSRLAALGARPAQVPEPDWSRFISLWRRAVAQAANELVARGGWSGRAVETSVTTELTELKRSFIARGVAPESLSPVVPPPALDDVVAVLGRAVRPTAVLYCVRSRGQLRFVRLGADGVNEFPMPRDQQEAALGAVDRFSSQLHDAGGAGDMGRAINELLGAVEPGLGPLLAAVTSDLSDGRLIWIPQGPLAAVPVAAVRCGDEMVVDRVSVLYAESLAGAMDGLRQPLTGRDEPITLAAVRGRADAGDAATEGGAALVGASAEQLPTTLDELNDAVAGARIVHLSCHGVFDWGAPLASYLKLGFDLPVADLFDRVRLSPQSLVVLGTCDSGTVAQTDLNEGIGVPAGLLAAGAATVIGAGWPVAQPVAVGVCRKVFEGLQSGEASPEALRGAARWIRDATGADLLAELEAVGHPLAPRLAEAKSVLQRRAFADPWLWAAYLHWGTPWVGGVSERWTSLSPT